MFALIFGILIVWTTFNRPKTSLKPVPVPQDTLKETTTANEPESIEISGDTIPIEKENYRVILASVGGAVKSFYLKAYDIDIVPPGQYLFITKTKNEPNKAIQFSYRVYDDSVVFKYQGIEKKYYFTDDFGFRLTSNFPDAAGQILSLKSGLNVTEIKNRGEDLRHFNVYVKEKTSNSRTITKEIKDVYEYSGTIDWFGLRNKYFLLVINNEGTIENIRFYKILKDAEESNKTATNSEADIYRAIFGCPFYAGGGSNRYGAEIIGRASLDLTVLLLPIQYSELGKFKRGYEQVTSGGLWGPIARVILLIFNVLYGIVRNYGFVIVIFAVLIKLIFFPLSRQMIESQHKMQLLQPELKKIQQKYKDEPQKLNAEMMHLYKTYKVNPFGGCLPLLVQMPIFFALYQTLGTSIEFRGAPFVFWITDLSYKDPYYVLPIAMGIMMLVQSLMTTIDPRQRFMVLVMPVFLVFIFLNLPSGLQLYWFVYNILTVLEHYLAKRRGGIK